MVKKILLALVLLILVLIAGFFTWRYIGYVRDTNPDKTFLLPRVEISVMEITSLTAEKVEMNLKMLIENHLPVTFKADSLEYNLFIDETEILRNRYQKTITLESNDSSWVSLPMTILTEQLKAIIEHNEKKNIDSVEYRLQLSFFTDIIFRKHFELDLTRLLPLIYIPEVTTEHLKVDSLNFRRAVILLDVAVKNQNLFPLQANNIAYRFSIEDHEWIEGFIPGLTDIKAGSTTALQIPIRLTFKEVKRTLIDLLKEGGMVTYELHLTFKVETKQVMAENSTVILKSSGTLKSLRDATKGEN